ncbi:uncharacterized protein LOC119613296 isoform X3 [Lucilia sericata]|uniref:uncharacterized protein LOC119613296 isoform X3 n=1 Tax=Lucilia sericata TaxID=13632 RepID=UPI0018A82680|nr:uncharacterized protein LOC119613296 isoform X3 [Lucilia sericata]
MESTGGSSGSAMTAAAAMPSPSVVADGSKATNYEFDPSISEEERRFYLKAYPTVDVVRERKTHCTVCKVHIGTAPVQENGIKMHPILRVTHCNKCHDFYNSGEFSKGEDGSELYCRWCGQGGEVYCCSSCPYVFCKSCIVKNLSRGVVADIEQNENWNCFSCAPKILWPLRAQHWALMNYIEQQKKEIYALHLSESELKLNLSKDRSRCCRLAKSKCGNMSDSMESLDSVASKRSHGSGQSAKKPMKHSATPSPQQMNAAKRAKTNDEVVCTPDLLSMLEPDCQITVSQKPNRPMNTPSATTPKIMSIQQPQGGYGAMSSTPKTSAPPPLVLRNTAIKLRPAAPPPVVRRTIIGPRTPTPGGNGTPVYHTINGYRIDLNSAAQQETFRLPNGKLIQVKRQGPPTPQNASPTANNWQRMSSPQPQRVIPQTIASRPVQITQHPYNISVQQQPGQHPQVVRYHNSMIGSTSINQVNHNGTTIQVVNGQMSAGPQQAQQQQPPPIPSGPVRPVMVRHVFPDNPIGQARAGLQDQVFNAMEICTHLTNKVQTLTNSNAYKQARNFLEVKELYIHLSYLLTYAIGRFKSLQDKCLGDMRTLGFGNDADCLENGQLAADKQASDDEDNEIEIVEPKTDLITLDSDDDEPSATSPAKNQQTNAQNKTQQQSFSSTQHSVDVKVKPATIAPANRQVVIKPAAPAAAAPPAEENMDLMSMAQSFLASMLEVDIQEGPVNSPGSDSSGQKKQPRKKLTNKPNPTLLKQKALMELERLEEMKRNDQKLKMKCAVELKKAEEVFPFAKEMLEAKAKEKQEYEEAKKNKLEQKEVIELEDEKDKSNEKLEDSLNSYTEEIKENKDKDSCSATIEEKEAADETSIEIIEINNSAAEEKDNERDTSKDITDKEVSIEVIEDIEDTTTENIEEKENSEETKEKESSIEIIDKTEDIKEKEKEDKQKKEAEEVKEEDEKLNDNDKTETEAISETTEKEQDKDKEQTNALADKDKLAEVMEIEEKSPATPTKDEPMDIDESNEESIHKEPTVPEDKESKSIEIMQKEQEKEMDKIPTAATENNDKNEDKQLEKVLTQIEEIEKNEMELTKPTNVTLLSDKQELDNTTTATNIEKVKEKEKEKTLNEKASEEATNKTLPSSTTAELPHKETETNKTTAIGNETTATSSNGNV